MSKLTMCDETLRAIAVDNLSHHYQTGTSTTSIFRDVSLTVEAGQRVALIGRSGSGKSTLLNLISGLEPLQHGTVTLKGQALKALNDSQRTRLRGQEIGFIYQAFNLISTLTVGENIALPLALSGIAARFQHERLMPLLEAVGLAHRVHDYPDRLSGGEQQRVAIARALVHRPSLILADEPTGNLDAESGRHVLSLLNTLVEEQGAALLLVTHSMEVASIADQVLLLEPCGVRTLTLDELPSSAAW